MTKYHLVAVGVGVLIGVAFAPKIRSLPLLSKIPSV
jgi:hypothetical protein